jgi:hypothetical protein
LKNGSHQEHRAGRLLVADSLTRLKPDYLTLPEVLHDDISETKKPGRGETGTRD